MKQFIRLIGALLLIVNTCAVADQSTTPALQSLSAWTNQSGSTLYLDAIDPSTGKVTGHYINRAAGYGCQNISYPVTGWIYGTAITFTTNWESSTESCNSITSWTGFYAQNQGKGQISTLWQLVVNGSTNTNQIVQGSDVFTINTKNTKKSLINKK